MEQCKTCAFWHRAYPKMAPGWGQCFGRGMTYPRLLTQESDTCDKYENRETVEAALDAPH